MPLTVPMPDEERVSSWMKGIKRTYLPSFKERFKGMAYADDIETAVTCLAELFMVIYSCGLMEKTSGVKLTRGPNSGECCILLLGSWKITLTVGQADIPNIIHVPSQLGFVGVTHCDTTTRTIGANGNVIIKKVKSRLGGGEAHAGGLPKNDLNQLNSLLACTYKLFGMPKLTKLLLKMYNGNACENGDTHKFQ